MVSQLSVGIGVGVVVTARAGVTGWANPVTAVDDTTIGVGVSEETEGRETQAAVATEMRTTVKPTKTVDVGHLRR